MSKTKWAIVILGVIDLLLITMHFTGYVVLVLNPTGYIIPVIINLLAVSVILFRSKFPKIWVVTVIISLHLIMIPVILFHGFLIWLQDYNYTETASFKGKSLVIEYRHATLGETTYFYNFYKTKFGLIGQRLDSQSFDIMTRDYSFGIDAQHFLGLGKEKWLNSDTVRFFTEKGIKDVHLNSSRKFNESENHSKIGSAEEDVNMEESLKNFINQAKDRKDGETIKINGNVLTIRYDAATGQEWIDVSNGRIPIQQCSWIVVNEEQQAYMLEKCTHQWEYFLYPLITRE